MSKEGGTDYRLQRGGKGLKGVLSFTGCIRASGVAPSSSVKNELSHVDRFVVCNFIWAERVCPSVFMFWSLTGRVMDRAFESNRRMGSEVSLLCFHEANNSNPASNSATTALAKSDV